MVDASFMSEVELDTALHSERFFKIHEDLTEKMAEDQYELGRALSQLLVEIYDEKNIFVSDNVWASEILSVEVTAKIIDIHFITSLSKFLIYHEINYGVIITVCDTSDICGEEAGSHYLGRIILNSQEIVVEDSLKSLWDKSFDGAKYSNM